MNKERLNYYKSKLMRERKNAQDLISKLYDNDAINTGVEFSTELSYYDNHTGDFAAEMVDQARGRAFKENEITIIKKIDEALKEIESETYGICKSCGKEIPEERLEFLPYAQFCVPCQNHLNSQAKSDKINRGPEEGVLGSPFGYGFNDYDVDEDIEYDAEDSIQDAFMFNRLDDVYEYYEDDENDVYPIEKISNEQYRSQLPD